VILLNDVLSAHGGIDRWRITGCLAPDRRSDYREDDVTIETLDGVPMARRDDPRSVLHDHADRAWDDLDLAFFCGILIWSCLAAPFLLAGPDVTVKEIGAWGERGETWQRLKAVFPPTAGTLATDQTFYFDQHGSTISISC